MPSKNQIRITVPIWIADLKGWNKKTNLQIVMEAKVDSRKISKHAPVIVKEVE